MEWWVWFIVFWAVFGCGRGCRRGLIGRRRRREDRLRGERSARGGQIPAQTHGTIVAPVGARGGERVAVLSGGEPPARETAFDKLQREFVEGVITVEQFEEAIDRMDPRQLR